MKAPSLLTDPAAAALLARLQNAPWRVVRSGALSGADQMTLDMALLETASEASGCMLRFYGWSPPAVSLGRFQPVAGVDLGAAGDRGWDVVRRPTGGRAVLHQYELTYALVIPAETLAGAGVRTSYTVLTEALHGGLRRLLASAPHPLVSGGEAAACARPPRGEANCFALASECDSLAAGRKLIGSAQVRRDGALLQHGSILLDADRDAWTALFANAGHLVTLRELLGETPSAEDVAAAITGGFEAAGIRLVPGEISSAEQDAARRLRAELGLLV